MTIPLKIALGVGAATASVVAVAETPQIPMPAFTDSGQVFLAGLIALQLLLRYLDRRQERKWKLEDRAAQIAERAEVRRKVDEAATEVKTAARATARTLAINTIDIKAELAKNTALTQEVGRKADIAYEVGNHINEKIEAVGGVRRVAPSEERRKSKE